jgi:hypothetical protein
MKFSKRTLATETLNKSQENYIDLPRDYFIQKMLLRLDITYSTGTSVNKSGTIWDVIKEVRVEREGKRSDTPFKLTGQQIRALSKYDYMKEPSYTDFITTTSQTGVLAQAFIPVDFRIDKWNDTDVSALLDAFNYSALKLVVKLGSESDVGSGYTFSAQSLVPTLVEAIPESGEKAISVFNHTLSYASFGSVSANQACDLRTGAIMRRLALITTSNSAITDFEIKSGAQNVIPKTNFLANQNIDLIEYSPPSIETGWAFIDFAEINGVQGALNLMDAKQGDVKLFITPSGSSASVTVLYDLIEK